MLGTKTMAPTEIVPKSFREHQFYPWLIWILGAGFFFAEYFARVAPSVMVPQLMETFQVDALSLGALSAFFYYAYVLMQVPVGALVDRYGPHRLLTLTPLVCALGCLLFATSQTLWVAQLSRFMMGFGASFAFVGTLKLATVWFSNTRFGLLAGLTQALGMLGAAMGAGPLSMVVKGVGWQNTMLMIGATLLVLAILIGIFVRDRPNGASVSAAHHNHHQTTYTIVSGLGIVLRNPQSWINALFVGLLYAPTASFAELWGVSYLSRTHSLDPQIAASCISFIFIGWAIGSPLLGWFSDRIQRRRPALLFSVIASLCLMTIILYVPIHSVPLLFALLFLYGLSNTGVATSYAVASEINPHPVAGTSMAFANMASVIVGAAFQPLIGWFLDLQWDGQMENGARIFSTHAYQMSMMALPICLALGIGVVMFVKESYVSLKTSPLHGH